MATATLSGTPTVLNDAESTSGWNGDTFSLEPDIKVQGSNSISCTQTGNGNNDVYVTGFTGFTLSTDKHFRLWFNITYIGNLASSNQIQVWCSDGTNTAYWTWSKASGYSGGWAQAVVYTGNTPTSGTKPTGTITQVGMRFVTTSKPRNVPANAYFDYWTYGDGYIVTGGTSGDDIDWSHVAALDKASAYGIVEQVDDVFFFAGDVKVGNGATTTYFKSGQKVQFRDLDVSSTLYGVTFQGSGCHVEINGGSWGAAGTQDFKFDASDTNLASFSLSGVQFNKANSVLFKSGQNISNAVFDDCGQVDPSTSAFSGCTFLNSTDTGGALLWPSDDSNISDLKFINCDNGVEYASTSDSTSPTFDNVTFDDVSGKYDVNNTSGSAVTISKNNGSNPNSYNPGGSAVTFAGASVTTKITVKDLSTGSVIQGARVLVYPTNGNNFPYQDSVSITGSGTTATVTHTSHGLSTGDYVIISGVTNDDDYNGVHQITVTDADHYTYTADDTLSASALGTPLATFAFISGTTDVNGEISDTRQVPTNQEVTGWVRKTSSSPYYKQGVVSGIVDSTTGLNLIIQLARDE